MNISRSKEISAQKNDNNTKKQNENQCYLHFFSMADLIEF